MSIASWTSPAASGSTFPISRAISSARSSFWSASSWPKRKRISPRLGAGTSRHSSYAAFAASTARSTSSGPDFGKVPSVSPVAGTVVSKVSPEAASTHSPPMKFLKVFVVVAMGGDSIQPSVGARSGLRLGGRIRTRKTPRVRTTPVTDRALPAVLAPVAAVFAFAAVDDDGHVRVVPIVVDHLLEELVLELARDHAVDHPPPDSRDVVAQRHSRLVARFGSAPTEVLTHRPGRSSQVTSSVASELSILRPLPSALITNVPPKTRP